jgi:dihydropteroate synthase
MMFDTSPQLDCNGRVLKPDLPRVMGIVNVTPDSFADGGEHATVEAPQVDAIMEAANRHRR